MSEGVPNTTNGLSPIEVEEKVIESKTICYCSNFDININEWFNEYENIEIFKINIKKNLGKNISLTIFRKNVVIVFQRSHSIIIK